MQRKIIDKMIAWKDSNNLKPLLLMGSKCVGKTYLACEFGKTFYKKTIYLNFENDKSVIALFMNQVEGENETHEVENYALCTDLNVILNRICDRYEVNMEDFNSNSPILFIFDEITFLPNYSEILALFQNSNWVLPTIAITSSIKQLYTKEDSIFLCIPIFALDFEEFLNAIGYEWYIDVIREHFDNNKKLPSIVHNELLSLFELYLTVGGMPLAINEYLNSKSTKNIREIHKIISEFCINNLSYDSDESLILKIKHVFNCIHRQLEKENKKFQYKLIRKGVTKKLYEDAIDFISKSNLAIKCNKLLGIKEDKLEIDEDSFKLYHMDVGILNSNENESTDAVRKGIFENYIAQALISNGYNPCFWESNSQAKIDFIINKDNKLVPIEVKVDNYTRSKSLSIFHSLFKTNFSVKISTRNFEFSNHVKYIPVYAAFCI